MTIKELEELEGYFEDNDQLIINGISFFARDMEIRTPFLYVSCGVLESEVDYGSFLIPASEIKAISFNEYKEQHD